MINNSTIDRWKRLENKSLDQQFINEIIYGLNCSPFEASAVLDTVYKVFGNFFESGLCLTPGQIRLSVLSIDAKISRSISESKQITVTLTLNDGKEDLQIRRQHGVIGLRRHKIQRLCQQAFDQGGLLTVEDLAYRIFNCGQRTICRDLQYFKDKDIFIALRSTVKDIGRSLSHRLQVIKLWAKGKQYSEIALSTCHSLNAIQNYVDKFKRTITLFKEGYNVHKISFLLRLSDSLVQEYIQLYDQLDFIEPRKEELHSLLKKSLSSKHQELRQ